MDKSFLIKKHDRFFCSKCMKEVYIKDSTSKEVIRKRHERECNTKIVNIYSPKDIENIYCYKLSVVDNKLILDIMQGYSENDSMKLRVIYTAKFSPNSKVVEENGEENIYFWKEMIRADFFFDDLENSNALNISSEEEISIVRKIFPNVFYLNNFADFIEIYLRKGFKVFSKNYDKELAKIMPQRINLNIGKENHKTNIKMCFIKEHIVLDEAFFEVTYVAGKCIQGKIVPDVKYRCILNNNYLYNPENMDLNLFNDSSLVYANFRYDKFATYHPEVKLDEYVRSGGKKILPFIMSSNSDFKLELIGKAGLGYIADNYEYFKDAKDDATNVKDMFGLPVKALKCLNSKDMIDHVMATKNIHAYVKIYNYQRMIFSEVFNKSTIEFIKDNVERRIPLVANFDMKDLLRYVKYTQSDVFKEYNNGSDVYIRDYMDYLNMCHRNDLYPGGKFPKDLKHYHDLMCNYMKEKINAEKDIAFVDALANPNYQKLVTRPNDIDDFVILMPRNANDLVEESYNMHNCVRSYIDSVARGNTYILFLRYKKKMATSYVTIEVNSEYNLRQVKGSCNTPPDEKVVEFVKAWAKKKGVNYDYCYDIRRG